LETIGDLRRKLDKAKQHSRPRMKEEEGDETKQNCNNIHDLVTTKEEEGNHQHNNNIQGPRTKEEGDALDMLEVDNKPIF